MRKTHGWFGLWGATLGLLFGTSGIWLNHRAVLKLPVLAQRSEMQIALPDPAPPDAAALAAWLQSTLHLAAPATAIRSEAARPVAWTGRDRSQPRRQTPPPEQPRDGGPADAPPAASAVATTVLMQPEHWTISFGGPQLTLQAETWAGNRSVSVRRVDNGFIGTLTNLHKGVGMPVAWILLVDTLAGSLILLSLSGLTLWMLTHRRRTVGVVIFGAGLLLTAGLAVSRL